MTVPARTGDIGARILREQLDSMMRTGSDSAIAAFFIGPRFWTIARARTGDRAHGLGMGLALVSRLADLMAMPLALREQPGRGPCSGCGRRSPCRRPAAKPAGRPADWSLHVLVIDDEAQVRASTAAALERARMKVALAEDGSEARAARERAAPVDALI